MWQSVKKSRGLWLVAGLMLGLAVAGLWPEKTVHAVATAQQDNLVMCTGPVEEGLEAVFILDPLTGDLKGAVLSPKTGKFLTKYEHNILGDLGEKSIKNQKYLMVTGIADFQRLPGNPQLGATVIYIAEITSGKLLAYGIPWMHQQANSLQPVEAPFLPLDVGQFRTVPVVDE